MKRVKKNAIVISSDSEDSDYEVNPRKKAKTVKTKKSPSKNENQIPKLDKQIDFSTESSTWSPFEIIAKELNLPQKNVENTCLLLEQGNSIPFLARYRREVTGEMSVDTLRRVKDTLGILNGVKEKAKKALSAIDKRGKLTPYLRNSILGCQSVPEIEHFFAPFKSGSKATLAERARKLGLGICAEKLLDGSEQMFLETFIAKGTKGKENIDEVRLGVQHIMADMMVHDRDMVDLVRNLQLNCHLVLQTKMAKGKPWEKSSKTESLKNIDPSKFENYFDFSCACKQIKPHQVLAINRGESLKVLSVKVNIPEWFFHQLQNFVQRKWINAGRFNPTRVDLIKASLDDAYKRLISPLVQRQMRSNLTKTAEEASVSVFSSNLRSLLLTTPYRGQNLLAIDPGFSNGCKLSVLSQSGGLLDHAVIYPNYRQLSSLSDSVAVRKLLELVLKHKATTIAIGNGTACRETESMISSLISENKFLPLEVKYAIVSEQGASIYSCSDIAKEEFPSLDMNIVSSISIGRRLQDPLSELVKIEPQHLGVGMYQHDVSQAKLKAALEEIVVECVSFVGVDVNLCSQHILKRIAGLNSATAKAIVEHREKYGDFNNREELKKVKGIGDKVFTQCAGFIRVRNIRGKDVKAKNIKTCHLDNTQIHPESYEVAMKIINQAGCNVSDIGSGGFVNKITKFVERRNVDDLSRELKLGLSTLNMLLDFLQKVDGYDYREGFGAPLFKRGLTKLEDIKVGEILSGRVTNVTHFGAFVDIGVGNDGLVHSSKMRGFRIELGQRIEVQVISIEINKKRIGLQMNKILEK